MQCIYQPFRWHYGDSEKVMKRTKESFSTSRGQARAVEVRFSFPNNVEICLNFHHQRQFIYFYLSVVNLDAKWFASSSCSFNFKMFKLTFTGNNINVTRCKSNVSQNKWNFIKTNSNEKRCGTHSFFVSLLNLLRGSLTRTRGFWEQLAAPTVLPANRTQKRQKYPRR